MATYSPVITSGTPLLQVSMAGGISYAELLYMLGTLNLAVNKFFIESRSGNQVNTNMQYTIYDSNGQAVQNTLKPRKSPYQRQNSLVFSPPKGNAAVILNGLSSLSFNLQPMDMVSLTLCVDQTDPTSMAPGKLVDNFTAPPDTLGNYSQWKAKLHNSCP